MDDFVSFGVFDKAADVDIDRRFLPHWFQPGVATFITFRTADSMPREVVEKWRTELRAWLGSRGVVLRVDEKLPTVEQLQRRIDGGREFLGKESDGGASGYIENANTDAERRATLNNFIAVGASLWMTSSRLEFSTKRQMSI